MQSLAALPPSASLNPLLGALEAVSAPISLVKAPLGCAEGRFRTRSALEYLTEGDAGVVTAEAK